MNDIYTAFNEFFELVMADSEELLREVYRLRYQVLCIEKRLPGFDASRYLNGLEKDEYDRHSSHILLRHRSSNSFIGTVRLILQDPLDPGKPFPIELHAQIDSDIVDINHLPRQHVAEISRFTIIGQFSKRRARYADVNTELRRKCITNRRRFPSICVALIVGIVRMCAKHNISHWLSVMDPALNRLLSCYGSNLYPIGPFIDYHGIRRPYYIKLVDVLDRMYENHREIWELVTDYGRICPLPMNDVKE